MKKTDEAKKQKIKETYNKTKERRHSQICKVYKLKVDKSRLSKKTLFDLQRMFVEAKWLRNAIIGSEDIFGFDTTVKEVSIKVGEIFETRPFLVIGSQVKQSIQAQIKSEIIINQLIALFCLVSKWVCVQDDYVKGWQKIWGKRLFETSIGGILGKLKQLPTTRVVDRWLPTSQECRICHLKTKLMLAERWFACKHCGHTEHRDLHSAQNIRAMCITSWIGAEHTESSEKSTDFSESTPGDITTSAFMLQCLNRIPHVQACLVNEPGSPSL